MTRNEASGAPTRSRDRGAVRIAAVAVLMAAALATTGPRGDIVPGLVLACWLVAALLLWLVPRRAPAAQAAVFAAAGAAFDAAPALALAGYRGAPSALAAGAVCVACATLARLEARVGLRIAGALCLAAGGVALRALAGASVIEFVPALAVALAAGLGGRGSVTPRAEEEREDVASLPPEEPEDELPLARDAADARMRELVRSLRFTSDGLQRQLDATRASLALRRASDSDVRLEDLARRVTGLLCESFGYAAATVWLLDPADRELVYAGGAGGQGRPRPIRGEDHLLAKVALTGAASLTERPSPGGRDPAVAGRHDTLGAQIVLPLTSRDETSGVLCLHRPKGRAPLGRRPSPEQLDWASSVAHAVRELTATRDNVRQRDALEVLYELARTFEAGRPTAELLDEGLRLLNRAVHFDCATVLLVDPEDGRLAVQATLGEPVELRGEIEFARGWGISAWVAENGRSLVLDDALGDARWSVTDPEVRSFASYPLLSEQGETVGVLNLSARRPGVYGGEERRLLQIFASQIALTARRSDLYARLEDMAHRDPSTGVHNERYLTLVLERESATAAAREGGRFALLLLHPGRRGERVRPNALHVAAQAATEATASLEGVVCRWETDRLAVVLPEADRGQVELVLGAIAARAGAIPLSYGSAVCPEDGSTPMEVLSAASLRLGESLRPDRALS